MVVEFGIIAGIYIPVVMIFPFPISIPITVVPLALVASYRRKRAIRRTGLLVTKDRRFLLSMLAHYSLIILALFGVGFFLGFPFNLFLLPIVIAIIALFVHRFRKRYPVVGLRNGMA